MKTRRLRWFVWVAPALLTAACARTDARPTTTVKPGTATDETGKVYKIEGTAQARGGTATSDGKAANERADVPGGTVGIISDDAGIATRVKSRLLGDPLVKGLKIDVASSGGVVYLTGTVQTEHEREQVIKLARATEGVKAVQTTDLRTRFSTVGPG